MTSSVALQPDLTLSKDSPAYRPDIDGLRALAVLAVIFYHASVPFCGGGYAGVDVFFVISGFLITGLIVREIKAGAFALADFYERRARRILPALVFTAAACVPLVLCLEAKQPALAFFSTLLLSSVFASNLYFQHGPDAFTRLNPLEHSWSLAIEEQFYLFFPLFTLLLARKKGALLKAAAAVAALSLALCALAGFETSHGGANPGAYYLLPYRIWELMSGALLALYLTEAPAAGFPADTRWREGLGWGGLAALLLSFTVLDRDAPWSLLSAVLPCLGTLCVLLAGAPREPAGGAAAPASFSRLLSSPLPVGLGRLSYSLYLWHWPVLVVFARGGHINSKQKLFAALITAFMAVVSYFYIELPVRRKKLLKTRAAVTLFSLVATALLAAAALAGIFYESGR